MNTVDARKINVGTVALGGLIEQRVDIALDTRDAGIRDVLMKMGWTPPQAIDEPYVRHIEAALGVAQPDKSTVHFMPFDFGVSMGVTVEYPSGNRMSWRVEFKPGWAAEIIALALEWQAPRAAELGLP